MIKTLILIILAGMSFFRAHGQEPDSFRNYFLQKKLLLPSQLQVFDRLSRSNEKYFRRQIRKRLRKEQNEEVKEILRKDLKELDQEMGRIRLVLPVGNDADTLACLLPYLLGSARGTVTITLTRYSTSYPPKGDKDFYPVDREELQAFSQALLQAGLISDEVAQLAGEWVADQRIIDSFSLVSKVLDWKGREEYYSIGNIGPLLDKLRALDLIDPDGYQEVKGLALQKKLRSTTEIIARCRRAAVVDLNEYGDYPNDYMLPLYREISSILADLSFQDFRVAIDTFRVPYDTFTNYHTIVSLTNNGRSYTHADFYSPSDFDDDGHPDHMWKTGDDLLYLFNQILIDQHSDYRIHQTNGGVYAGNGQDGQLGFIALTKQEVDSLGSSPFFYFDPHVYEETIRSDEIDHAVTIYREAGLFDHLNPAEMDSCMQVLHQSPIRSYNEILSIFKDLVFQIDLEYGIEAGQYRRLTEDISRISKGQFAPVDIIDTYDWRKRKQFEYGFMLGGRKYRVTLHQEDDWLDPGFWDLIEQAISEQDRTGKFYSLYPSDGLRVIYLTPAQREILKQNHVIELGGMEPED